MVRENTYNATPTYMFYPTCSTKPKIKLRQVHIKYTSKLKMKPKSLNTSIQKWMYTTTANHTN